MSPCQNFSTSYFLGEADTLLSTFVVWALIYAEVQSFHDAFIIVQVATVENDC